MNTPQNGTSDAAWPVYVLTLEGDEERRAPLLAALDALGIGYQLKIGIDGRKGLPAEYEVMVNRKAAALRHDRMLTEGELACSLSHRAIYESICAMGLPGAVVLEDDAIIDARFADFLQSRSYKAADLILLDHSHARVRGKPRDFMPGVVLRRLSLNAHLSTGYSLTLAAAQWLLAETTPIRSQADWPGDMTEIGAMVAWPQLVGHPDADGPISHLQAQRKMHKDPRSSANRAFWRVVSPAFWRRWFAKRFSTRIS